MSFRLVGPGGSPTIGPAIAAAAHGDTIGIQDGTYPESLGWAAGYLHLVGLGDAVFVTGTIFNVPTLAISGTGGGSLERLTFSNANSAHPNVIMLNVYQHICRRVRVNGTGGKICFRAQYLENCIAYNGLTGFVASCPGENVLRHVTVVNMTGQGIVCNAANGSVQGCLVANTVGGSIVNYNTQTSLWNVTGDGILAGADGISLLVPDIAFTNLGAGDVSLTDQSRAWFDGVPQLPVDFTGKRRRRFNNLTPRIYAGAYDPWPPAPSYVTGGPSVRKV